MPDFNSTDTGSTTEKPDCSNETKRTVGIPPVRPLPPSRSSNGCLLAVIFTLGFFAIFVFGGVLFLNSGAKVLTKLVDVASDSVAAKNNNDPYYEEVLTGDSTTSRIAVIPLTGPIFGTGNSYYGVGAVHSACAMLKKAANDPTVSAVILHIDSPGGGLSASDIIYNEILKLKQQGKKVLVYVGQLCASGGYYVAAPSDYIVAGPTALVGSFGVIMEHVEVSGLMNKLGIVVDPLKSTESKDIGSPFRKMSAEEKEFFDHILNTYHNRFVDIISNGRGIKRSEVEKLANGKVYLAKEALNYGLIDKIGYFDDCLNEAIKACTVDYPQVFIYKQQFSVMDLFRNETKIELPDISEFMNKNSGTELNLIYRGIQSNTSDK